MSWTQEPSPRGDLPIEGLKALDGGGDWSDDWHDSAGVDTLRVAAYFLGSPGSGSFTVEQGVFDNSASGGSGARVVKSTVTASVSDHAYAEIPLAARFFRVRMDNGDPNGFAAITVRGV